MCLHTYWFRCSWRRWIHQESDETNIDYEAEDIEKEGPSSDSGQPLVNRNFEDDDAGRWYITKDDETLLDCKNQIDLLVKELLNLIFFFLGDW